MKCTLPAYCPRYLDAKRGVQPGRSRFRLLHPVAAHRPCVPHLLQVGPYRLPRVQADLHTTYAETWALRVRGNGRRERLVCVDKDARDPLGRLARTPQ